MAAPEVQGGHDVIRDENAMPVESNLAESHDSAFDVAVRVARLGLESSGEGVETMERYVARVARAYGVAVDTVVLPPDPSGATRTGRRPDSCAELSLQALTTE